MFNLLKQKLINAAILKFPNYSKKFNIKTDVYLVGLGAVLAQKYKVNNLLINFPIAYASCSLSKAEQNYSVTDCEGLAVIWAIEHFRSYIFGLHFTLITDHSALKALTNKPNLTGCLQQRADKLMEYDFIIKYYIKSIA